MVRSYVGIDSTTFYKEGMSTFRAPLGVAVEVLDHVNFDKKYIEIIEALKKKHHLETDRCCIKGHFVHKKLGTNGVQFVADFVDAIIPSLRMIYVCHTILSPNTLPEVKACNGTKIIPTLEFVGKLCSSYPHIVAWNLLQDFADRDESRLYIDHFTGDTTKAWQTLDGNNNIFVLPAGEYCNSLISTADFICKYINDTIYQNHKKLGYEGISYAFENKLVTEIKRNMNPDEIRELLKSTKPHLHQRFIYSLSMITPDSNRQMDVDSKLRHPVSYILTSKILSKEKEAMETTPLYDIITNSAYKQNGCVRSINTDEIHNEIKYMKSGDSIITIGEPALEKAKYLVNDLTGLNIKIIPSIELLKKL